MRTVGVVCEYNPFHLGHARQLALLRQQDPEAAVVCLMSGLYVQRGQPAVFSRQVRARAALLAGADLVLELPVTVSLRSAEGFAAGGVEILDRLGVEGISFGAETADRETLLETARQLLSPQFGEALRPHLDEGLSFPAARSRALKDLGGDPAVLERPNDILAVEYCKAILARGSGLIPLPICRPGDYHALDADRENPSATALRRRIMAGEPWLAYVPEEARPAYEGAGVHSLALGERAVLARLRTLEEEAFAALPGASEGLWRKLLRGSRRQTGLEGLLTAVKSKRPGPDGPVRLPGPHSRRSGGGSALRPDSGLPGPWPPGSPGDVLPPPPGPRRPGDGRPLFCPGTAVRKTVRPLWPDVGSPGAAGAGGPPVA